LRIEDCDLEELLQVCLKTLQAGKRFPVTERLNLACFLGFGATSTSTIHHPNNPIWSGVFMAENLVRTFRLKDLVLIVIGTVIGSGIFIVPAVVLRLSEGHVGLALLVWLLAGVLSLIGALTYFAYFTAMGPQDAAGSERIAADAVSLTIGPVAGKLIAAAILVSMFSAANGVTLTASRVYFAMARDGVFFSRFAEIHPRFGTPALAIVWSSVCAIILAASGTFEQLLTYVIFAGWIFLALGAMSLFVYRRRHPELPRPFRVPGYPFTPILFILAAVALFVNTLVSQPARALVGIAVVLIGTPAFYLWRAKLRSLA
jgi:amino acid transporter